MFFASAIRPTAVPSASCGRTHSVACATLYIVEDILLDNQSPPPPVLAAQHVVSTVEVKVCTLLLAFSLRTKGTLYFVLVVILPVQQQEGRKRCHKLFFQDFLFIHSIRSLFWHSISSAVLNVALCARDRDCIAFLTIASNYCLIILCHSILLRSRYCPSEGSVARLEVLSAFSWRCMKIFLLGRKIEKYFTYESGLLVD